MVSGVLILLFFFGTGKPPSSRRTSGCPMPWLHSTPASALLHAVAVVKAGVFTVLKISTELVGTEVIGSQGGSRGLVCSGHHPADVHHRPDPPGTESTPRLFDHRPLNYIVLGAAVAFPMAIEGGALHIAMHAYGKITLFFAAGAIYVASHKTRVDQPTASAVECRGR